MYKCCAFLILIGLCTLLGACGENKRPVVGAELNSSGLERVPCQYGLSITVKLRCYVLNGVNGSTLTLPVTVISPRMLKTPFSSPLKEAVVFIPGGPGQGGMTDDDYVSYFIEWYGLVELEHDVVLFDPRVAFGSNGFWLCEEYEREALRVAGLDIPEQEEVELLLASTSACLAQYQKRLIKKFGLQTGFSELSTPSNVSDLSRILSGLDYSAYHLLGVSYGSRVALMAAQLPQVKSLVLDSPYPFSKGMLYEWPQLMVNALAIHEQAYKEHKWDEKSYAELLQRAFGEVEKKPLSFQLERWDGSAAIPFILNRDRLLSLQFNVLYSVEDLDFFYKALFMLPEKTDELEWVLEVHVNNMYDSKFNSFLFYATECVDNKQLSRTDFLKAVDGIEFFDANWAELYDWDVCAMFPEYYEAGDVKIQDRPYTVKPTVIFSGEYDPITPRSWAVELADTLAGSTLVEVDGAGHSVLRDQKCYWQGLTQFWRAPSQPLKFTCE